MKTNSLPKILSAATIVAMLSASSSVFAQVKIGTNPTTIGANSNLEVEASNNKKMIVHKNDGTVVIENTPSGAETDSLMTIDASGNVRKRSVAAAQKNPYFKASGSVTAPNFSPSTPTYVTNQTIQLQNNLPYVAANGEITANQAGIYYYTVVSTPENVVPGATTNDHCNLIYVNGVNTGLICSRSSSSIGGSATNSGIISLLGGDKVRVALTTAINAGSSSSFTVVTNLYKLSER